MIDGNNWPIPEKKLVDGGNLSLKNAIKLLNLANELFNKENPEYNISIYLAVISLEELGKAIMLIESAEAHEKIYKTKWKNKFENHKSKILAAVNHIKKFVDEEDPELENKLEKLNELKSFSLNIVNEKLATLYIDWNAERNNWDFYEEQSELKKRAKTELILKHADWLVRHYSKSIPERTAVILEMVEVGLAYGYCKNCDLKLTNLESIKIHHKKFPDHKIGFNEDQPIQDNRIHF